MAKIARDYAAYTAFAVSLAQTLVNKPAATLVSAMAEQAVALEAALAADLLGLAGGALALGGEPVKAVALQQLVQWTADQTLVALGQAPVWRVPNSMPWVAAVVKAEVARDEGSADKGQSPKHATEKPRAAADVAFSLDADF
jgi:hypothetical protein